MAYRNDRTERAQLHKLWITELDKPCAECGSKLRREVAHKNPFHNGGKTTAKNCRVLCRQCNLAEHPFAKFLLSDKVRLNDRVPERIDFTNYDRSRPRTIVRIRYDKLKQCNWYTLGSNGKGKMLDGQPLEGYRLYEFRSYQLIPYVPRAYHFIRPYHKKETNFVTGTNSPSTQKLAVESPTGLKPTARRLVVGRKRL